MLGTIIGKPVEPHVPPTPQPPAPAPVPVTPPQEEPPLVLVRVPDASSEIIDLEGEIHRLQEQQLTWPFNPPRPAQTEPELPPVDENHYWEMARKVGRVALVALCVILAFIPPLFVFMERWLQDSSIRDILRQTWCESQFFCDMWCHRLE